MSVDIRLVLTSKDNTLQIELLHIGARSLKGRLIFELLNYSKRNHHPQKLAPLAAKWL